MIYSHVWVRSRNLVTRGGTDFEWDMNAAVDTSSHAVHTREYVRMELFERLYTTV